MAKQTFTTGQVLTAAQMTSLQQTAMGGGSTTAKTASYTLVAADAGTVVQMNSSSATTITVNTALFAAGDTVQIQNVGAGVCTVTAGTATVSTAGSLALSQYEGGQLYFNTTSAALFFDLVQASGTASALTFINGATFTAVASFSLAANTFTATYDNYLVRFQLTDASAASAITLKLRAAGTDTSTNYYSAQYRLDYQLTVTSLGENATTSWGLGSISTGGTNQQIFQYDLNIKQPFNTKHTMVNSAGSLGNIVSSVGLLAKVDLTSYDSLTFACSSGTITGNYRVYGYANS